MSKGNQNFCTKCGNELKPKDNFCSKCGVQIQNDNNANKKNSVANIMIYVVATLFVFILIMMAVLKKSPTEATTSNTGDIPDLRLQDQSVHSFIEDLKSRIAQDPNDMTTVLVLANFLHDEGMIQEAISYYKKYLEKNAKDPDAIVDLGICYFELGESQTAIAEMEKAIVLNPKHQKAYYNIGIISLREKDFKKAMEYFEKCYKVDPTDPTGVQAKAILDQHRSRI
jgi:tetratricopeptide (TPR) repeat protein/predicted nucleic acid-binding Zn ribbon protein